MTPDMLADEIKRINPFDWDTEFADIIKAGGFDAVMGIRRMSGRKHLDWNLKSTQRNTTRHMREQLDLYVYFFEKAHSLLIKGGYFGMICSNKFMRANYGINLRKFISTKSKIIQIIDFGELPVFQNAATFPAIFITQNSCDKDQNFVYAPIKQLNFVSIDEEVLKIGKMLDSRSLHENHWTLVDNDQTDLILKMKNVGTPFGQYVNGKIFYGLKTGLNKAFVIDEKTKNTLISKEPQSKLLIKPFINGDDIRKYRINYQKQFLIYIPWHFPLTNDKTVSGASKRAELEFKSNYPVIFEYLNQFREELSKRNAAETGIRYEWYALQRYGPETMKNLKNPK